MGYPEQSDQLGARVRVAFQSNLMDLAEGDIIRADAEDPKLVIIQLDDGRVVLGSECVFTVDTTEPPTITKANEAEHREGLERAINEKIQAFEGWPETGQKAAAQEIAEEVTGGFWAINVHAAMGARPKVFVGRYKGEYAPEA